MSLDERSYGSDIGGTIASNGYVQIGDLAYGVIETGAGYDHDLYSFITQPGVTYTILLTPTTFPGLATTALLNPYFGLRDSNGSLIGTSVNYGASQIYTATANSYDKYFVDVIGSTYLTSTGGYFVALSSNIYDDFNGTINVPLNLGYSRSGTLEQVSDVDVFSVSVITGHSYFLQLSSPIISDLFAVVKDGFGRVLDFGSQGSGASYSFTAFSTQTGYLGISSNSSLQTGSYSVFFQERADITKALSVGFTTSDNITYSDGISREVWGWDGSDNISLGSGNDLVFGGNGNDSIHAGNGNDYIAGEAGNDYVDGGAGIDAAIYSSKISNYTVTKRAGTYTVTDKSGGDGVDSLTNIEHLQFADKTINLTVQAKAASAPQADVTRLAELYVAFFNRVPDADGMSYWIDQMSAGQSITQIADSFYSAGGQYSSLTGFSTGMTDADFVKVIYKNVLGRTGTTAPPDADVNYWVNNLTSGADSRGSLINTILGAAHSYKGDATWGWVPDLLDNKITVAKSFSIDWGLSYNTANESITEGMAIAAAVTPTDTSAAITLIGVNGSDLLLA
jgi:Ca2+-binding RTX toxin-like protein